MAPAKRNYTTIKRVIRDLGYSGQLSYRATTVNCLRDDIVPLIVALPYSCSPSAIGRVISKIVVDSID